jgi:hypothetical protein
MPVRARHLTRGLIVTAALLTAALPAESAVQLAQPAPEVEKAPSCTVGRPPEDRVTRDRDLPAPEGPRAPARDRVADGKPAPRSEPAHPEVCPLHPEQEPGPPRGRP